MSWPTVPLPEVFWFQEGPGLRNWQFTTEGIKILNVGNIMPDGSIDLSRTDRHLSKEEFEAKYSHFSVDEGDLVIASSGISFDPDGYLRTKIGFIEEEHLPLCMNTSTIRFKATEGVSCLRYLKHWFQSHEFRQQVSQRVTGSAQLNFGPSHLKSMKITLPPLEEQKRIAGILDQADALRRLRTRALDRLNTLGQAIFHEMFGDPTKNPMGWDEIKLGELCGVGSSKRVFVSEFVEDGVPFYRGTEVGRLATGQSIKPDLFISKEHYESLAEQSGKPEIGDLLLPSICHDGRIWRVDSKHPFYFKDGRVLWIKSHSAEIDGEYLRNQLRNMFLQNYNSIASGTTFAELKIVNLKNLKLLYPPLELQRSFSSRIEDVQQQQSALKKSEIALSNLFASLQHRAFRGEL